MMNEKKNWGSTVLGWFVVKGEDDPLPVADSAAGSDLAPPGLEEAPPPAAPAFVTAPPPAPGGNVDFDAVFEAGGSDAEERGRISKAAQLLASLPEGTDPTVKRQIVEASLKAFGVPIDQIIEAAAEQVQVLEAYQRAGAADTKKVAEEAERKIAAFEEEIRRIRQVVAERVQEQVGVVNACNQRKLEVQRVLEFFGQEAVARVVRDSPKLIDPTAPIPPTKEK